MLFVEQLYLSHCFDSQFFHFFIERRSIDTKLVGGYVSVPVVGPEHLQNDAAFRAFQSFAQRLIRG